MNWKMIFVAALLGVSAGARAANDNQIVSCWDGTFAYGHVKISQLGEQPNLLQVTLQSEDQSKFLKNVTTGTTEVWGQGQIMFYVPQKNCQQTGERPDLMTCEIHNDGILYIDYTENIESARKLSLVIKDLKMTTTLADNVYTVNLSASTGSSYIKNPSTVQMQFRTDANGKCHSL